MSTPAQNVRLVPPVRTEYELPLDALADAQSGEPGESAANAARPLSSALLRRVVSAGWFSRTLIALALIAIWEITARVIANDLLLPSFGATFSAFVQGIASGELLMKTAISMSVLLRGYLIGVVLAFALTSLAVSTHIGRNLLSMLTAMFNPLPSIALLPIALLWFGLGTGSLLFVLVHAVLWPLALSMYTGFLGVPATLRMAGRNYGDADSRARGIAFDCRRLARGLGIRVAHADRGGTRVRCECGAGRARLVHLPEPQRALYGPRVCGARGGHHHRFARRTSGVRYARTADRAAVGRAALRRGIGCASRSRPVRLR
jgi:hypothetical protein